MFYLHFDRDVIFLWYCCPTDQSAKCTCGRIALSFCSSETPSNHSFEVSPRRYHKGWSIWTPDGGQQRKHFDLRPKPPSKRVLRFQFFKWQLNIWKHNCAAHKMLGQLLKAYFCFFLHIFPLGDFCVKKKKRISVRFLSLQEVNKPSNYGKPLIKVTIKRVKSR